MKNIYSIVAICILFFSSCANISSNGITAKNSNSICDIFLTDCHDGVFRSLDTNFTVSDLFKKYRGKELLLQVEVMFLLADTTKHAITNDINLDSMNYCFNKPIKSSEGKMTKLVGLTYFFTISGSQSHTRFVADSIEACLIKNYHGSENPSAFKVFEKMSNEDSKLTSEGGNNIYYVYSPQISFMLYFKDNYFMLVVRFSNMQV